MSVTIQQVSDCLNSLNAALVVTETSSRDIRFFTSFRRTIISNLEAKLKRSYSFLKDVEVTFAGDVSWYSPSKNKNYWVLYLGMVSLRITPNIEGAKPVVIKLGTLDLFFKDGNRGYICCGYKSSVFSADKREAMRVFKNGSDLADSLARSMYIWINTQHTLNLRNMELNVSSTESVNNVYALPSGIYPVFYGGISAGAAFICQALAEGGFAEFRDAKNLQLSLLGGKQAPIEWISEDSENLPFEVVPVGSNGQNKEFRFGVAFQKCESIQEAEDLAFKYMNRLFKTNKMHSFGEVGYYDSTSKTIMSSKKVILAKVVK